MGQRADPTRGLDADTGHSARAAASRANRWLRPLPSLRPADNQDQTQARRSRARRSFDRRWPGGRSELPAQLLPPAHRTPPRQLRLRDGETIPLDHDAQNVLVWVRKPRAITPLNPAIVVLCNFSSAPVTLSLKADMARLHLRGSFLRTVLRSDSTMGTMHLDGMTLPPHEVYIGELRY